MHLSDWHQKFTSKVQEVSQLGIMFIQVPEGGIVVANQGIYKQALNKVGQQSVASAEFGQWKQNFVDLAVCQRVDLAFNLVDNNWECAAFAWRSVTLQHLVHLGKVLLGKAQSFSRVLCSSSLNHLLIISKWMRLKAIRLSKRRWQIKIEQKDFKNNSVKKR